MDDKANTDAPKAPLKSDVKKVETDIKELGTDIGQTVSDVEAAVKAGVDQFIADHLRNSPFSRATEAWNHFQAGVPVLIGNIVKKLEG